MPHGDRFAVVLHQILPVLGTGATFAQPNATTKILALALVRRHEQLDTGILQLGGGQLEREGFVPDRIRRIVRTDRAGFALLRSLIVHQQVELKGSGRRSEDESTAL